jgi:hypothetical protein
MLPALVFPQDKYSIISDTTFPADTGTLYLHAEFTHFIRNNEYFNPIVEGYTLIGASTREGLLYAPSSNTRVYAGVEALSFWGGKPFHFFLPDFSFMARYRSGFSLVMGTLPAAHQRGYIPLLLDQETLFSSPRERGLSIGFARKHVNWNTYLAWQRFLLPAEHAQEILDVGTNLDIKAIHTSSFILSLPLQFTAHHQGGQINDQFMPVKMNYNNAAGIKTRLLLSGIVMGGEYYFVGHKLDSGTGDIPFLNGMGHYSRLYFESSLFLFQASYWDGYQYYSPLGEDIYSSVSVRIPLTNPPSHQPFRQLLNYDGYFKIKIAKTVSLLTGVELFYDIRNTILDYNYMLAIRWSGDFMLWKKK